MTLSIASWNILAPSWAAVEYYYPSSAPFLNREKRREAILKVVKRLCIDEKHDFVALQEIEQGEIQILLQHFNQLGYSGSYAFHDDLYWQSDITQEVPFASNGVALFWRRATVYKLYTTNVALSNQGNHCIVGLFVIANNRLARVASCHFDADYANRRNAEATALMNYFDIYDTEYLHAAHRRPEESIDIIAGDLNFSTATGPLANILVAKAQFVDAHNSLGVAVSTHPFTKKYQKNDNYGIIDHILIRNATKIIGASTEDFDVMQLASHEESRVNLLLQKSGSDHFLIRAAIRLS